MKLGRITRPFRVQKIMPLAAPTTPTVLLPLHDAKSVVMVEAMGAMIRSVEMVATTGARSAEMVEAMVALMTKIVGVQMAVLMVKGVVDSKEVVVVAVLPLPSKMSRVRFAKNMGTLLMNVGGVTPTRMMAMILALTRRVHMVLTQTGIWTVVPLTISRVN
jgi:hypothetical protein